MFEQDDSVGSEESLFRKRETLTAFFMALAGRLAFAARQKKTFFPFFLWVNDILRCSVFLYRLALNV